jgi:hypothetical protein
MPAEVSLGTFIYLVYFSVDVHLQELMKEHTPVDTGAWLRGDYQTLFHGISGR